MSTSELKFHLHQLIDRISDSSVLNAVHTLLSKATEEKDWWDELSEKEKELILKGAEQADNGNFVSHDEVKRKVNQLLGRA